MSTEHEKSLTEIAIFHDFIARAALPIDPRTIEKRAPPEPDLICNFGTLGKAAFELVELCDSSIAKAYADPSPGTHGVQYIRTSDPSSNIILKKLRKKYVTPHPIELLCYTAGRIITPPSVIIPTIVPILESHRHTFRRAWLLAANQAHVIWDTA